jgi:hypothetical protein
MAGLSVPETLSLEELHAETCLALPERDLMQTVTIVNTNGAGSGAGSSVFSEGVGVGIGVLVLPPA